MKQNKSIPVIDLAPLTQADTRITEKLINEIADAYTKVGFAYLINHGISEDVIKNAFIAAEQFHALPLSEKEKIKQNPTFRGYMGNHGSFFKVSTSGKAKKPNNSEAFIIGNEVDESVENFGKNLSGPNQWPENLDNFKVSVMEYFNASKKLAEKLLTVFSLAFGLEKEGLNEYFKNPNIVMRLQYYPPQETHEEAMAGIAAHTDYGFMTLLAQDDVGGLQVETTNGEWIDVPPLQNALVLNSGDMLKRLTNNTFKSTTHRVISNGERQRFSIPFFFEPDLSAEIAPLPQFTNHDEKPEPILYGQHLMTRIINNYPNLGAISTFPLIKKDSIKKNK